MMRKRCWSGGEKHADLIFELLISLETLYSTLIFFLYLEQKIFKYLHLTLILTEH
jgi:hypothetical protein